VYSSCLEVERTEKWVTVTQRQPSSSLNSEEIDQNIRRKDTEEAERGNGFSPLVWVISQSRYNHSLRCCLDVSLLASRSPRS